MWRLNPIEGCSAKRGWGPLSSREQFLDSPRWQITDAQAVLVIHTAIALRISDQQTSRKTSVVRRSDGQRLTMGWRAEVGCIRKHRLRSVVSLAITPLSHRETGDTVALPTDIQEGTVPWQTICSVISLSHFFRIRAGESIIFSHSVLSKLRLDAPCHLHASSLLAVFILRRSSNRIPREYPFMH